MPITTTISPTQDDAQTALVAFLTDILPAGTVIIAAQPNRVAEPAITNFVMMTPIRFERIETNIDSYQDVKFTASVAGTVLTVTTVNFGSITLGATLNGVGVLSGTTILSQQSGTPGGAGAYTVSQSQNISSETMSAGVKLLQQNSILTVQLDFHSADYSASSMAQTTSTMLRDEYGVNFFSNLPAPQNNIAPLYADDPTMQPFINDQQQYEWRWVLDCKLQINQTVVVPQDFFDLGVVVTVDAGTFPP